VGGCSQPYCGRLGILISACLLSRPVVERPSLVPLCANGAAGDRRDLWPQPRQGNGEQRARINLRKALCRQLCRGDMTLKEAQAIFLEPDWTKAYMRYLGTR
jgi:hypothetical protein